MSWLVEDGPNQWRLAEDFRKLVESGPILRLPGAHDGLTAQLAKRHDFKAIYLSGAAYTASRGLPDLGLIYSTEVAERARELVRASGLPLLVDIDTGFGGILNVARTAKEMVEAKAAAVQIEDQEMPKKCGHLDGKRLIPAAEMAQKIGTIKTAAPNLFVVARTDARSVEGLEAAIKRADLYLAAGADAIFPEALESEEEFRSFAEYVKAPLLANMTEFGKTPYFRADQFESWGYRMVIYPVSSMRAAAKAIERVLAEIAQTGTQKAALANMQTREELYDTIRYRDYEAMESKIFHALLPDESPPD
ncbi:methylisocitrate lyase [Cohnella pontilimi]|uniref:Methylisocitrate lyase n=1 Tax=Cohnella pontilimi TaxID=2564100 RepID=A0A4U0FG92_9BACL|nr:methylisocitrate lyase [Cohnella pontilimi]TJY44013.1 methylisocitrate lyase [Cohnella pontilimi]